jgi:glutaredoxin
MDRGRCQEHGLILGEGGCIRCRRDAERGKGRALLGVVVGIVALAIAGMGTVRAALAVRDHVAAKPDPIVQATNAPSLAPTPTPSPSPTPTPTPSPSPSPPDDREQRIASEMRNVSVTLYSADYCPWCRKAKEHMNSRGISYTERRIDQSPEAKREMNRIGGEGIPTIDIEGDVNSGFNPTWVERVVRAHAERRARVR